jgi:arylsulfatase A-like enzyme
MVDFWIGRLLGKLDALNLTDNTIVVFTTDHGFYFGEHDYFGKAEWVHEPNAVVSENSNLPAWLSESWLLTVQWSPLYNEISRIPLMARGPGLTPGHRQAMTTAPDIAPTILDLTGLANPMTMKGESFGGVLTGQKSEHRPFVVSSWPLYMAEGEITTAVDSTPRKVASYMPFTVTTRERSAILGGPNDQPELYDLRTDPGETNNVWRSRPGEGESLCEGAIGFLEDQGTPEQHLTPRREALDGWRNPVELTG